MTNVCPVCSHRLSTLVNLVSEGLQMGWCSEEARVDFGERLKTAIGSFTVDFLPHMREEEEVCVCVCVRGVFCVYQRAYITP